MKQANSQTNKSTNVRFENRLVTTLGAVINGIGTVAPTAATGIAARLFLSTRRNSHWKSDPLLKTAKTFRVRQGDQEVQFYSWGHGPTVLLVHGWNGWGTQLSQFIPPLLERGYRVFTFDALGHGASEGHRSSIFKFADSVALADKIAGPFYAIVAHSMGGPAATLALKDSVHAERLVYLAPPFDPSGYLGHFSRMLKLNPNLQILLKKRFEETYGERWKIFQDPRMVEGIDTPLLVIHDRNDPQVDWDEGRRLAAAWQGARFHGTEGLGHNRLLKDADVIQRTVDFIHPPKLLTDKNTVKGESHENNSIPLAEELLQSVYA